jgi:chitinase
VVQVVGGSVKPVVGYLYRGVPTDTQLRQLTHVAHSFAVPTNGSGGLSVNRPDVLAGLVPRAHALDCKVLISIFGGLGVNTPAHKNAKNSVINARAALVNNIMAIVDRYGLDGVDLDLEPIGEASDAYVLLLRDLRARLGPNRVLSAAVLAGYAWAGFKPAGFQYVDFLVIMTYDDDLPPEPHAGRKFAEYYINQWTAAGLPIAKTVAGAPAYGQPGSDLTYRKIIASGGSPNLDSVFLNGQLVGYNGQPTVRWKVQTWGGVGFWEIYGDTLDGTSLILAAHEAAQPPIAPVPDWWRTWFPNN